MKGGWKVLLAVIAAVVVNLSLAPAALAHGDAAGDHASTEGPLGLLLLPPEFVLGGVAFFGVLYAVKRSRG